MSVYLYRFVRFLGRWHMCSTWRT